VPASFDPCKAVVERPQFTLNIPPQPTDPRSIHVRSPSGRAA
jgi:hypothetical protein